MRNVLIGLALIGLQTTAVSAGSDLLKDVKRNPAASQSNVQGFQNAQ
jgi:hypothetical protein